MSEYHFSTFMHKMHKQGKISQLTPCLNSKLLCRETSVNPRAVVRWRKWDETNSIAYGSLITSIPQQEMGPCTLSEFFLLEVRFPCSYIHKYTLGIWNFGALLTLEYSVICMCVRSWWRTEECDIYYSHF